MKDSKTTQDLAAEVRQLMDAGGCLPLSDFVHVRITGADRHKWFNNFCTADVMSLQPGQGSETFVLNVKGKTIALLYVLISDCDIALLGLGRPEISLAEHLDRYIFREDVQVTDLVPAHELWWLAGAKNQELLAQWGSDLPYLSHRLVMDKTIAIASSVCADRDQLILIERSARAAWESKLNEHSIQLCSRQAFEYCRIQQSTPWNGSEVTLACLPQEFRRDKQAVSFTKGCYLGQETVARIDALGHVNRYFVKLEFSVVDLIEPGTLLAIGGKTIGNITSSIELKDENQTWALGFVRREHASAGLRIDCQPAAATVVG